MESERYTLITTSMLSLRVNYTNNQSKLVKHEISLKFYKVDM